MTQYNSLNVKLSNSQLNKLKSSIKNENDVVLRISSNMVSNSNDNTNFPHELLLTNRQVANIRKAFANHSSIDIKSMEVFKKKMLGSGMTTLIISNDEMDDILKIVKSLENSGLLLKGVSETIQHEAKEQRGGFLGMLLDTLGASLLGDVLSKGLSGKGVIRAGEGTIRAGYGSKGSSLKKI